MLDLRRAPARPRQTVIVALVRASFVRALRHQVEVRLVRHVRLEPLRRLAAVAGRPAAAVHFAQDVLGDRHIVLDLDVLEHLVGEAELLGEQVHDLEIVLQFEDRLDDLLAPLHRAVGRDARAAAFELRGDRQQVHVVLAAGLDRERGPGGRMRIGDHQQVERLQALQRFGDAGDGVAGVTLHDHRLQIVFLRDLILRQQRRVEPARQRDAGGLHHLLVVETADQIVVVDLPDARPMLPRAFDEAVVERQRHDIEADVGRALHVVVAAEDVGAGARTRRHCR